MHKFPGTDVAAFIQAVDNGTLAEYVSFEADRLRGAGKHDVRLTSVCAACKKPCGDLETYCSDTCRVRTEKKKREREAAGEVSECVICMAAVPSTRLGRCACKSDMLCQGCYDVMKDSTEECPVCKQKTKRAREDEGWWDESEESEEDPESEESEDPESEESEDPESEDPESEEESEDPESEEESESSVDPSEYKP